VSGLVSGLAAASLGGVPTASATCVGIFGININLGDGGGCTSSLFGFALGLGPGTIARAQGFFVGAISVGLGNTPTDLTAAAATGAFTLAYAGGANATTLTRGNLALAVGQGSNTFTQAGGTPVDVGNVALNLGNGNVVHAGSQIAPPRGGPLAIAGAIGVSNRTFSQPGFGVTLATPFNNTGSNTNVLAAGGTAGNRVRLNSTGGNTNGVAATVTQGNRVRPSLNAVSNRSETASSGGLVRKVASGRITKSAKKFSGPAGRGTSGRTGDAKAGAAGASGCDK
jgi:hypothetical protein